LPKRAPTIGVTPYVNPKQAKIAMLNRLLQNDADANASVEYLPIIMLSANPVAIAPSCPMSMGNPNLRIMTYSFFTHYAKRTKALAEAVPL
jgi:hypothetical protein